MPKGRLIVTCSDGTWTDRLSIRRYRLSAEEGTLVVNLEVMTRAVPTGSRAAQLALGELAARRMSLHTIQVGAQGFRKALQERLCQSDCRAVGIKLSGASLDVSYPAGVFFGPDAVTLHLG